MEVEANLPLVIDKQRVGVCDGFTSQDRGPQEVTLAAGVAPTRMAVVPANLLLLQVYRNKEASVAGVTKSDMLRARAAAVALQQSRMRVPPDLINQDAAEATWKQGVTFMR